MEPNIVDTLTKVTKEFPNKIAIIDKSSSITYKYFELAVHKTAQHLQNSGVKKGDSVLVLIPVSIDLYRVTMAINYLGAAAIFIEDWITFKQIGKCCEVSKPNAVVSNIQGLIFCYFQRSLRKIPLKINHNKFRKTAQIKQAPQIDQDDIAIISFTSGSSGTPKMLSRSYHFLSHQFYTLRDVKKSTKNEIELITLPAFLFINLAMGSTSVIADFNKLKPHKISIKKIEAQLLNHQVNSMCCSPSFLLKLAYNLNNPTLQSKIKKITTGGAPVFPEDAKIIKDSFQNAQTTIIYGASEAEPISVTDCSRLSQNLEKISKGLSVGQIHPNTLVNIYPVFGDLKINSNITIGEILVSGPNVLLDDDENQHNKSIINGTKWHHTGDSGYINHENELILTGPISSIISYNKQLWSPFIFEGLTKKIKGVSRATIAKVDNKLIAVVQAAQGAEKAFIRKQILNLSIPLDAVAFIKQFPKDSRHDGKIKYSKLELMIQKKGLSLQ